MSKRWLTYAFPAAAATVALALALSTPFTARADGPNDWPMFRRDLAHTGLS